MKIQYSEGFKNDLKRLFSNNPIYSIPRTLRDWKYEVKWAWQRVFRGFDDRAYWGLYNEITKIALPVLKNMRDNKRGTNAMYFVTPETTDEEAAQLQHESLEKMIRAFQLIHDDEHFVTPKDEEEEIRIGMDLFAKNFRSLWD